MDTSPPTLWALYDSGTESWRRGRVILLCIGLYHFFVNAVAIGSEIVSGDIERVFIVGTEATVFWILFYLVWLGVEWIRWIWGAGTLLFGFCVAVWAWRDWNVFEAIHGSITLVIGAYLCSPSVHSFAQHQKQRVRLFESLVSAAAALMLLATTAAIGVGLLVFREQVRRDACEFGDEAARHIYAEHDRSWAVSHVTRHSLQKGGSDRVTHFLSDTEQRLGQTRQFGSAGGMLRLRYRFPSTFDAVAHVVIQADAQFGPAALHFILMKEQDGWRIDRMWWEWAPQIESGHR